MLLEATANFLVTGVLFYRQEHARRTHRCGMSDDEFASGDASEKSLNPPAEALSDPSPPTVTRERLGDPLD